MKQWFVGMTKDQKESQACEILWDQGFVVYLPKVYLRQQEGRSIRAESKLRFTGYIFISFDKEKDSFGCINGTRGMDELIINGTGDPVALPAGIINQLRRIEDQEFARALARKKPKPRTDLQPGDAVIITAGTAKGVKGSYLGSEKGIGSVLCGMAVWKPDDADLKKIDQAERKRA